MKTLVCAAAAQQLGSSKADRQPTSDSLIVKLIILSVFIISGQIEEPIYVGDSAEGCA